MDGKSLPLLHALSVSALWQTRRPISIFASAHVHLAPPSPIYRPTLRTRYRFYPVVRVASSLFSPLFGSPGPWNPVRGRTLLPALSFINRVHPPSELHCLLVLCRPFLIVVYSESRNSALQNALFGLLVRRLLVELSR